MKYCHTEIFSLWYFQSPVASYENDEILILWQLKKVTQEEEIC